MRPPTPPEMQDTGAGDPQPESDPIREVRERRTAVQGAVFFPGIELISGLAEPAPAAAEDVADGQAIDPGGGVVAIGHRGSSGSGGMRIASRGPSRFATGPGSCR